MDSKNAFRLTIGWAMLTILAIAATTVRIIKHNPYYVSLLIAVLMLVVSIYLFVQRRIDGPSFFNFVDDERLRHISVKSQSNAFWFIFVSIWFLAVVIEFFNLIIIHQYLSLILAAIGTIALFIYMFRFIWQKYMVHN